MDYTTWKLIHITGACLFIGNNLVTPFWRFFAERNGDSRVVAFSQRLITFTDIVFTGGGIALLLLGGHMMAAIQPGFWQQAWFFWAYVAFVASGVVWMAILLPLQLQQSRLARIFADGSAIPPRFRQLSARWNLAGGVASLLPLVSLWLMVMKPQ